MEQNKDRYMAANNKDGMKRFRPGPRRLEQKWKLQCYVKRETLEAIRDRAELRGMTMGEVVDGMKLATIDQLPAAKRGAQPETGITYTSEGNQERAEMGTAPETGPGSPGYIDL